MVFSAHGINPCITNSWTKTRKRSWSLRVRCAPWRTGVACVLTDWDFVTGPSAVTDISCILNGWSVPFGADGANSLEDRGPSTWQRTSSDRDRLAGARGWSIVVASTIQSFNDQSPLRFKTTPNDTVVPYVYWQNKTLFNPLKGRCVTGYNLPSGSNLHF